MCFKMFKATHLFIHYTLLLISVFLFIGISVAQDTSAPTQSSTEPTVDADNVAELTETFDNWQLRAYEGDRDAQFKVALMFSEGTGTEKDTEQAVYWYIQASRQGLASAQYNLGHKYLNGDGVNKDVSQAVQWWLKAAEQEHELAQFNVARAYYGGIGVEKNIEHAHYWFRKAAANNEPRSEKILVSIFQEEPGSVPITLSKTIAVASKETATATQTTPVTNIVKAQNTNESAVTTTTTTTTVNNDSQPQIKADNSIAVYNRPDKNSILVSIIPKNAKISVVKTTANWLRVRTDNGFPVWVHTDFVNVEGDTATITGNNVNARAVPLILRGSVIGQLFKGNKLQVLESKEEWIRLQSTTNFTAWIERSELDSLASQPESNVQQPALAKTEEKPVAVKQSAQSKPQATIVKTPPSQTQTATELNKTVNSNEQYAFKNIRNDNNWLFGLPEKYFTIQLASFSADSELNTFLKNQSLTNDPNVKQFISNRNGIEWKYLLYGSYINREAAEKTKAGKKFKNAWVRKVSQIRKNRCIAWKTILPTPKELQTYCQ